MLGRALSLAALTLLIGCFTAGVARAQENLDAGKSPSQIFSSTCSACHKSPRGLLKTTSASALPGFLRQHYTTGTEMARVLAGYLISNGAADPRYQSREQPRQARQDGRLEPQTDRFGRRQPQPAPAQEAARPDEAVPGLRDGRRQGRDARRYARPQDATRPDDGQAPAATDSKSGSRQKNRRGKRQVEEPAKSEQAPAGDAAKTDAARDTSRSDPGKSEPAGSATGAPDNAAGDSAKTDTRREEPAKPAADSVKPAESGADSRSDSARAAPPKENGTSESSASPAASSTPVPAPPAAESK